MTGLFLLLSCTENHLVVFEGVDVFTQNPSYDVDILLVVDDSCSMEPFQEQLATTFESFVRFLDQSQTAWHIAVNTTDVAEHEGQIVDFIAWDDEDAAEAFAAAVDVGTEGSGFEMGLEAARRTLEVDATGFIRADATFSAIFVSDEEDASPLGVSEYIRTLEALKGARDRESVDVSALVTKDVEGCEGDWSSVGDRYLRAAEMTDGVSGDLCTEDFGPIVTDMGLSASRQHDVFELSGLPAPDTLELSLDDEVLPCGEGRWAYELRGEQSVVVFDRDQLPPPESLLVVRYQWGDGSEEAFCR